MCIRDSFKGIPGPVRAFGTVGSSGEKEGKQSFLRQMDDEKEKIRLKDLDTPQNPFYNERAAGFKREIDSLSSSVKDWQKEFKEKTGRAPSLQDMKEDPHLAQVLDNLKSSKRNLKTSIQRFRIN
eukprot:TRINITY_DN11687_c0_g2_i2.p1 TRINITY_DN11687_c0_g2~~TRINITY_DN11687_c0_g2_i2.p1  ORF type:complete len:141 (+),score=37.45 TRINITY_DN11687_c0_g2_i2:49-423(+)